MDPIHPYGTETDFVELQGYSGCEALLAGVAAESPRAEVLPGEGGTDQNQWR